MKVIITAVSDDIGATIIVIITAISYHIQKSKGTLDILGKAKDAMMIVIKGQVEMQRML